jgi:hypothetical protein
VGVDRVDGATIGAGEYAERIPAAGHRALHVAYAGASDDLVAAWNATMLGIPLSVVVSDDFVGGFGAAVTGLIAAGDVAEVVVILARRRAAGTTDGTLPRLVTCLRGIAGVAPVVLPPR